MFHARPLKGAPLLKLAEAAMALADTAPLAASSDGEEEEEAPEAAPLEAHRLPLQVDQRPPLLRQCLGFVCLKHLFGFHCSWSASCLP